MIDLLLLGSTKYTSLKIQKYNEALRFDFWRVCFICIYSFYKMPIRDHFRNVNAGDRANRLRPYPLPQAKDNSVNPNGFDIRPMNEVCRFNRGRYFQNKKKYRNIYKILYNGKAQLTVLQYSFLTFD